MADDHAICATLRASKNSIFFTCPVGVTSILIDISGGKLATQIPALAYERAQQENELL